MSNRSRIKKYSNLQSSHCLRNELSPQAIFNIWKIIVKENFSFQNHLPANFVRNCLYTEYFLNSHATFHYKKIYSRQVVRKISATSSSYTFFLNGIQSINMKVMVSKFKEWSHPFKNQKVFYSENKMWFLKFQMTLLVNRSKLLAILKTYGEDVFIPNLLGRNFGLFTLSVNWA